MSVNCVYCGHVNPDGSTVCVSCGRTLPPAPSQPSYGQQQPPQSWGTPPPPPQGQPPSSYPPANPYGGGSYPPADPGYGSQPPPQPQAPPSYGNQPGYGQASYPPQTPSYGQQPPAAVWGPEQQAYNQSDPAKTAKTLAMVGMICGIVGAVLGWCCYSGFLFGPAAIILGFLGKSKLASAGSQDGNTMALVAIGLGILAFIEPIVYIIIIFLIIGAGSIISH